MIGERAERLKWADHQGYKEEYQLKVSLHPFLLWIRRCFSETGDLSHTLRDLLLIDAHYVGCGGARILEIVRAKFRRLYLCTDANKQKIS